LVKRLFHPDRTWGERESPGTQLDLKKFRNRNRIVQSSARHRGRGARRATARQHQEGNGGGAVELRSIQLLGGSCTNMLGANEANADDRLQMVGNEESRIRVSSQKETEAAE
jgi:hypothetical protein